MTGRGQRLQQEYGPSLPPTLTAYLVAGGSQDLPGLELATVRPLTLHGTGTMHGRQPERERSFTVDINGMVIEQLAKLKVKEQLSDAATRRRAAGACRNARPRQSNPCPRVEDR